MEFVFNSPPDLTLDALLETAKEEKITGAVLVGFDANGDLHVSSMGRDFEDVVDTLEAALNFMNADEDDEE